MNCKQCGSEAIGMVDTEGAVQEGPFVEWYECGVCEARGQIRGNAEASPAEWREMGSLFNEH